MASFRELALVLLGHSTLATPVSRYYLTEVETYFHDDGHPDPFVNCHEEQLNQNTFYVHSHGMDITFGATGYGGMLIRSIQRCDDGARFNGPCKVISRILADCGLETLRQLRENCNDVWNCNLIRLHTHEQCHAHTIMCGPRVGLKSTATELQRRYIGMNYRYATPGGATQQKKLMHVMAI